MIVVAAMGAAVLTVPTAANADLSADVIESGTITWNGQPAAGATVLARVWPTVDVLSALPAGAAVPTLPVGTATTGADGRYQLLLDPAKVPAGYVAADGSVNVEVVVTATGQTADWSANPTLGVSTTADPWSAAGSGTLAPTLSVDLGSAPSVLDDGAPASAMLDDGGNPVGGPDAIPIVTAPATGCSPGWIATSTYHTEEAEHVVDAYGWTGAQVTADQLHGTSHAMGIALGTSIGGAFSPSGSQTTTVSTSTEHAQANMADKAIYNGVNYRFYENGSCPQTEWRPSSFYTALDFRYIHSITHHDYTYCTPEPSGHVITKNSGSGFAFSTGVALQGVKNSSGGTLSVSSTSSWTSASQLTWSTTAQSKYCGNSSMGPDSSPLVSVGQPTGGGGCGIPAEPDRRPPGTTPDVIAC